METQPLTIYTLGLGTAGEKYQGEENEKTRHKVIDIKKLTKVVKVKKLTSD